MKAKFKVLTLLSCIVLSIFCSTPTFASTIPINESNMIVPYERGSCQDLVNAGFKYNCPTGPGGRPRSGRVILTASQWDCLFRVYGIIPTAIMKTAGLPLYLWETYRACQNEF